AVDSGHRGLMSRTVEALMVRSRSATGVAAAPEEPPGLSNSVDPTAASEPSIAVRGIGAPRRVEPAMLSDGAPYRLPGATLGTSEPGSGQLGPGLCAGAAGVTDTDIATAAMVAVVTRRVRPANERLPAPRIAGDG